MSDVTDILVGVDKLLSGHGFCGMASARYQLSLAIFIHNQRLKQAHRQGWEQCKEEAVRVAKQKAGYVGYPIDCCQEDYENYLIGSAIADAITSMEYKEAKDE